MGWRRGRFRIKRIHMVTPACSQVYFLVILVKVNMVIMVIMVMVVIMVVDKENLLFPCICYPSFSVHIERV